MPIGGAYRLIDVPMSNCINSGINKVYILTQFNSASLNRHLARAYNFSNGVSFGDGFVEVYKTSMLILLISSHTLNMLVFDPNYSGRYFGHQSDFSYRSMQIKANTINLLLGMLIYLNRAMINIFSSLRRP